jgi:hypothetical protein
MQMFTTIHRIWLGGLLAAAVAAVTLSAPNAAGLAAPVPGATGGADVTTGANVGARVDQQMRINIAWQVALEGADFSPGIIDGAFGTKGKMALKEYAARYFPGLQMFDVKVYQALKVDVPAALALYTITSEDAAQVGGPIPDDWNIKASMSRLNYESLADCIAEKFHCTQGLLSKLNPGVALAVGQKVVVPNVRPFPVDYVLKVDKRPGATSVTVNLGEKTIRVFDRDNGELALFHCSEFPSRNLSARPDRTAVSV